MVLDQRSLKEANCRLLILTSKSSQVSLSVSPDIWAAAELVKEKIRVESNSVADFDVDFNEFELMLSLMRHALDKTMITDVSVPIIPFLSMAFSQFCERFLKGNDPHAIFPGLVESLSLEESLRIFYDVDTFLKHGGIAVARIRNMPVLFNKVFEKKARVMVIFGGQGNTEGLFEELLLIYSTYGSLIREFLQVLSNVLLKCAEHEDARDLLENGLDVINWIQNVESRPDNEYLISKPVSMPLIGLIQLMNYWVTLKVLGWSPATLAAKITCTTGHSQGIVSAVVIATSKSEEEFIRNSQHALRLLFWIGVRGQQACPIIELPPSIIKDSLENQEGHPTSMLAVTNLDLTKLQAEIDLCNEHLPFERRIEVSLMNGPKAFVCSGPSLSLYGLSMRLRKLKANSSDNQSRIPFILRRTKFSTRYLPISGPSHCFDHKKIVPIILEDCRRFGISLDSNKIFLPVYHTRTGKHLKEEGCLVSSLVKQICSEHVHWNLAMDQIDVTHILDFGPGHASGIGALTHRHKIGSGVQIILAGSQYSRNPSLQTKQAIFNSDPGSIVYGPNWKSEYSPQLTEANGKCFVDTRFSRLLGKPPLMVAGMTPCTVAEPFCTAIMMAGYHVELAGGGHHNEEVLRAKIDDIIAKVGPNCSITLNCLFLNPRLWAFQYPLVKKMRQEGYPIEGFTIAAGVPSFENACEIVESMRESGIRHVSFKPSSIETIKEVIRIAQSCPNMPLVIQWTGGRGGGHHSFEDFHQPILEMYSAIRSVPNLYLVAGSGFGDGPGSLPYLTGEWSLAYGVSPMPFDGILLGSRVMVAAENLLHDSVKELIVKTEGTKHEKDWVRSYNEPVGGVVTVRSELGEPIHKIATRGVLLWKELDETIFQLAKDKRLSVILKHKAYLIERINADYQKVWFGRKMETGRPVDLSEMTYYEVCMRLGDLCYVWHQKRWIHESYKKVLQLFLAQIEERFAPGENVPTIISEDLINSENNPRDMIEPFFNAYPMAKEKLMNPEDVQAFLNICALPSHKPVPFIPTFDDDKLEYWFKKDSLWQAEDLDAVIDQDPGRVCVLHGPVAAAYSTKANQPVKEILDEINDYYIQALKAAGVPVKQDVWFGGHSIFYPVDIAKELTIKHFETRDGSMIRFQLPEIGLPTLSQWLEVLSGPSKSWLRALLCSPYICKGPKKIVSNQIRNLLRPRPIFLAEISYLNDGITPISLRIAEGETELLLVTYDGECKRIRLTINYDRDGVNLPFELQFKFNPTEPYRLIEEDISHRIESTKQFYWNVFFGSGREVEYQANKSFDLIKGIFESTMQVDSERVKKFCRTVGNCAEIYSEGKIAPIDFGCAICLEASVKPFFVDAFNGDHLNCIYLWNEIEYCDPCSGYINADDVYTSRAQVIGITNGASGRTGTVEVNTFNAQGKCVFRVTAALLFRDNFDEAKGTIQFERIREDNFVVELKSHTDVTIVKEKSWIELNEGEDPQIGNVLCFSDLISFQKKLPDDSYDIEVTGSVLMQGTGLQYQKVGKVCYSGKALSRNPITAFLSRVGKALKKEHLFEDNDALAGPSEEFTIVTRKTNQAFSNCSGDYNPIHTCPMIADYVGLPTTITHGLWTCAAVRSVVENHAADGRALAVRKLRAEFVDMVLPGDRLQTRLRHIGMQNGLKLYSIQTYCGDRLVLKGRAEVEQPKTAYVFTGQGSQQVGMGMDLYSSNPVAKDLWDRADNHFRSNYGFSILEIIRNNPKTMEIHFGGSKGTQIRQYYMSLVYETISLDDEREVVTKRLFPEITEESTSYIFTSPAGLLNMTQFTQPAICLTEKVSFEVMRSKGLVCPNAAFAGHSLGEYAALASVVNLLSLESLCDVVFYRGLCMQIAVDRDANGRSPYGMVAINPTRVQQGFSQDALKFVVDCVQKRLGLLLEIVNYNVQDWQYVVAGHVNAIECLTQTLNHLNMVKFNCTTVGKTVAALAHIGESICEIIEEIHGKMKIALGKTRESLVVPQRGLASIPLPGIDVPFHSSLLLNGVAPFRAFLSKIITPGIVNPVLLEGKYIPNLIAKPFQLSRDYIRNIYETCHSPVLKDLIATDLPTTILTDPIESRVIATKLLIELLAYQFASPVRWIESQDVLFRPPLATERLIEIGPAPTLSGMAERTLKAKFEAFDVANGFRRVILNYSKDKAEIHYENNLSNFSNCDEFSRIAVSKPLSKNVPPTVVVEKNVQPDDQVTPVQPQVSEKNSKPIASLPIEASEVLLVIICNKTKKSPAQVPLSKSLKELSDGKSTLQNELVADLQKEFGGNALPDRAEEAPLQELAELLNKSSTFTKAPGKHVNGLISKLTSSKFPAGFNASDAKAFLSSEFALSSLASDTIFAFALFKEPEVRLPSEEAAKIWLKEVAIDYFHTHGIEFCAPVSGTINVASATISTVELDKIQAKHKAFLRQKIELYLAYLNDDQKRTQSTDGAYSEIAKLQSQLDYWIAEHGGEEYAEGIKPIFSVLKARRYDSWWNWSRQSAFEFYGQCLNEYLAVFDPETLEGLISSLGNKADQNLVDFLEYLTYAKTSAFHPAVTVDEERLKLARNVTGELLKEVRKGLDAKPLFKPFGKVTGPQTIISDEGRIEYQEIPRPESTFAEYVARVNSHNWICLVSRNDSNTWVKDSAQTTLYIEALESICRKGLSFMGKTFLMTGCGRASIGGEILRGLLMGGANVILTTSSYCRKNLAHLRTLYEECGSKGSTFIVVPFNQASKQDVDSLIDYIYSELGWDLDGVIPFGAISEAGKSLMDEVDGRSELAHRLMLTNVMRLLGAVAKAKASRGIVTRPAQVILPLSPNHGNFGNDGLYGESKASLETLLQKWHSEEWNDYLSIVGAVIGWTRGTGLMSDNNLVAEELERLGVYTFSVQEMALNILGLMHPILVRLADASPVLADLNGGFSCIKDLHLITRDIRSELQNRADLLGARHREALEESRQQKGQDQIEKTQAHIVKKRANFDFGFKAGSPTLSLKGHDGLAELLDLKQVIVVVGFGEVGPWGNSRTRWEMEAYGQFSLEGCIELAWIMGLIKFKGDGWVDATSGQMVPDFQVKAKYEEHILKHSGIRVVEPELLNGYDPNKKRMVQEVVLNEDMKPIELSSLEAEQFKLEHGDQVIITPIADSDRCMVKLLKGAVLYIPKALRFDRFVGGLIPTGWNAERYGIPKDIINQVDPITLFVLVSTVEALVSAGITDPYEFYQYVHLSELGNTSGSGLGGVRSLQKIFRLRFLDETVQSDIFQESFINSMPAWVNLLLLSSAGPIKTPVGACATAVESIDIGVETILSGKAQVVVVGGFDDFSEEGSFELASMKATSSAEAELAKGREPGEMSRPMTSSRSGFMESQGSGIQILMTAKLAIEMGCPIYGILAAVNTASDKEGRSVPAPGQGILTTAKCIPSSWTPRVLDIEYRLRQLREAKSAIQEWYERELAIACTEASKFSDASDCRTFLSARTNDLRLEADRRLTAEQRQWGQDFGQGDPRISPLTLALSRFGQTVDDIALASFHGTATKANDTNESMVLQQQLEQLGRSRGNVCLAVCQKYLTGHPKGAAAAWMLNGVLQAINEGIVPGNRNADNIEAKLQEMSLIHYPTKTVKCQIRAALLKSFGFGHVGGEVLVLHPDLILGTLSSASFEAYIAKRQTREARAQTHIYRALISPTEKLIELKESPPFPADLEAQAYLDPTVRAAYDSTAKSWVIGKKQLEASKKAFSDQTAALAKSLYVMTSHSHGVGIDVQLVNDVPVDNADFLDRNYTKAELEYCFAQPDVHATLAGRWAAKEAIVKALCSSSKDKPEWLQGAGAPLNGIEVLPSVSGAPSVCVNGKKMESLKVSISHSGSYAVALAQLP